MKLSWTELVLSRLEQLFNEIRVADLLQYYDRLREFKQHCDDTPVLANSLNQLPKAHYDFGIEWQRMDGQWPAGEAGKGFRWDAIVQIVDHGNLDRFYQQLGYPEWDYVLSKCTELFVLPLYNHLIHQVEASTTMLYILLRYKRWAEWFEAKRLRAIYKTDGEDGLGRDLRRFLFESGIDYPFSDPHSPGGRADIVAQLDTDDPLVLEAKVWDSEGGYRENRVRDGLRQVTDYADKYGKDSGYVPVFNLDREPLVFVSEPSSDEWPARIERGGRTYYFMAIEIAEQPESISQKDKGKRVEVNEVQLDKLWAERTESAG